jgi:pimeloyl-ACP methyl ester carboxylesterase/ketosteroid isomerase-like protein
MVHSIPVAVLTVAVCLCVFVATTTSGEAKRPHGNASVNGLKMYYEIHGVTGGKNLPLVLLHGGGSTIETTFGKVLPSFAKHRQVIAFEQQGHGRTADIVDRPFTFEQSADDTVALMDRLGIEKADCLGFSNGGNIALQIAIRHPSRVRKLVVASAMFKRDGLYLEFWEFMKRSTLEAMPNELKEAYRKLSPHPERLPTFHDKCAKRMLEFKDWRGEDIEAIQVPTLLMIGDADCVRPEHAVEMFRLLPHAQLAVLPGGHGAYIGEVTAARREDSQVRFGAANPSSKKESRVPDMVVAMIEEFLDAPMPEPKARRSTMSPQKPEEWPRLFEQHLNAGDLDAVMALYDPEARFVARSSETIVGRDEICKVLARLIGAKTRSHSRVVKAVTVGDVAYLYTDFAGTTLDGSGKAVEIRHKAIEVLRHQPDGDWKLIVGDPNGRERDAGRGLGPHGQQ